VSTRRSWARDPSRRAAWRSKKAGWSAGNLELIEANEAFVAQACAVNEDLRRDVAKVNVNGGAIARPSDRRFRCARARLHKGLATLCIGGGMGIAMCVWSSALVDQNAECSLAPHCGA
jgi:acetyl-CoA C-acetyltransferase